MIVSMLKIRLAMEDGMNFSSKKGDSSPTKYRFFILALKFTEKIATEYNKYILSNEVKWMSFRTVRSN
jgi:hypothetical protein